MEESAESGIHVIEFPEAAKLDFADSDNATAEPWGDEQAERCISFLCRILDTLAADSQFGRPVGHLPGKLVHIAKFSKKRGSHGHRIFYTEIEGGILVLRILHTVMNWQEHIGE